MYNVAVVGCGSIGALKPHGIDEPESGSILTHAHAAVRHPYVQLDTVIDTDVEKAMAAKAKWGARCALQRVGQLEGLPGIDIAIVSTPTEFHHQTISELCQLHHRPKAIIVEKPFCMNLKEAVGALNIADAAGVPIIVNYIRRFVSGYNVINAMFRTGNFGKALNCRMIYTRGMKRDGCHAVDLANWFFGPGKIVGQFGKPIIDLDETDPTQCTIFEHQLCDNVVFQPCDGRQYGIFETDICFENYRIRFIDNGLFYEIYPITDYNQWGHKSLSYALSDVFRKETQLPIAMLNVLDSAVKVLKNGKQPQCTADDAIAVHRILS